MSSPVTEVAYITLKPDTDLKSSPAWASTIKTLQGRQGFQRLRYGLTMEKPELLMLLIDWDALAAHQKFIDDPSYKPFVNTLLPLTTGLHLHHFTPSPFPPATLDTAPCIEFATFYNVTPEFSGNVGTFVKEALEGKEKVEGYYGTSFGESVEDDVEPHGEKQERKKGKALVLCIGWSSKDAHMAYRETEGFKEKVPLLRKGMEGVEVFHVAFKAVGR